MGKTANRIAGKEKWVENPTVKKKREGEGGARAVELARTWFLDCHPPVKHSVFLGGFKSGGL